MLAGDLVGPHQVGMSLPGNANMIVNGDFETLTVGSDNFYDPSEVTSWSTKDGAPINIFNYQGYDNVLDLDSTEYDFDQVYQDFETVAGNEYLVTFDFRSHPVFDAAATARTNDFEVLFNGNVVGEYSGADLWQTGAVTVMSDVTGSSELMFREIAEGANNAGDTQGALLDNIRVMNANAGSIVNGSFETTQDGVETFFRPWEVDGWAAMGDDVNDRYLKIFRNDQSVSQATDGNQYLNVDTRAGFTDMIYQNLQTTPGSTYFVSFDYRTDGPQGTDDITVRDEIRVQWQDVWASTISSEGDWRTVGLFLTADTDSSRLTFREPGDANGGDGSGALIDNVQIFEIESVDSQISLDFDPTSTGTAGTAHYVPSVGAQPIVSSAAIQSATSGMITSATVTLGDATDGSSEKLAISPDTIPDDGSGNPLITVTDYDPATQQLVLNGEATASQYTAVLESLVYFNGLKEMSTNSRTITVAINDSNLSGVEGSFSTSIAMSVETDQSTIDDAIIQKLIADTGINAVEVSPGLYMEITNPGTGINPTINSTVRVAYTGKFVELNSLNQMVEGSVFETSATEGATFSLQGVIAGWQQGIPQLKTDGTAKLLIPSRLAYGPSGSFTGTIPGDTVLVFDVELKQIFS